MSVTINGTSGVTFNDASNQTTAATGFGFKNRLINGSMVLDQRNAGASVTVNSAASLTYSVDRFYGYGQSSDGVFTLQQNSSVPTGQGFAYSLKATVTTADASIGATQIYQIGQRIEGYNVADFELGLASAATFTFSFWVRSSLTGTFGGALQNGGQNRSYPFSYTISAVDTWEKKTITLTGDTSGTWLKTNGTGLEIIWGLGVGSTYLGTANAWAGSYLSGVTGQTQVISTVSATFYITGVQLEKGSTATSFDYRPYSTELQLAQRYYEQNDAGATNGVYAVGYSSANNAARYVWFYKVPKRVAATISVSGAAHFIGQTGAGSNVTTASLGGSLSGSNQTSLSATFGGTSFTIGQGSQLLDNNAGASWIAASAEL
jgi:hypothetical protein